MPRKPTSPVDLARLLCEAAAELTANNPNRMVTVDRLVSHLEIEDGPAIEEAIMIAVFRLWLRTNPGKTTHSVILAPQWHYDRAFERKTATAPVKGRRPARKSP